MKIFYGVQGTGNGHITRARVMAKELKLAGIDVSFQFTGREANEYFDMEVFNGYQHKTGLTFNTNKGQVSYLKTAIESSPVRFVKDVKQLDLTDYDLVISDFEPVTAWAAKSQKKQVLGIGHQYAFNHQIPRAGADPLANTVMRYFAPADIGVGLHWHHFNQPILPPIIETPELSSTVIKNKILVYLPFESQEAVIKLLSPYTDYQFYMYSPVPIESKHSHIIYNPLSRDGFQKDLSDCVGIISNAGFELASEALKLGKKILAKPLHAQMEQISNAAALKQLNYGQTMMDMDPAIIKNWLEDDNAIKINYPNVARLIVDWIQQGMPPLDKEYTNKVWDKVDVIKLKI